MCIVAEKRVKNNPKSKWEQVDIKDIKDTNTYEFRCLDCQCELFYSKRRIQNGFGNKDKYTYYFKAGHKGHGKSRRRGEIKCHYDKSSKKVVHLGEDIFDFEKFFLLKSKIKEDSAQKSTSKVNLNDSENVLIEEEDEEAGSIDFEANVDFSINQIFEKISSLNIKDSFKVFTDRKDGLTENITVEDFFINKNTIKYHLNRDLNGVHLLVCSRMFPENFEIDAGRDFYLKINDAYRNKEDTIILKLNLIGISRLAFSKELFDDTHKNDNFILLTKLQKTKEDPHIYEAIVMKGTYLWMSKDEVNNILKN